MMINIEKGDGVVVKISMQCNCDCNKKRNEDDFKDEMLDKVGVLDLISKFEDYIIDVNRYGRLTRKRKEIESSSASMIDIIHDFKDVYSLGGNKPNEKER